MGTSFLTHLAATLNTQVCSGLLATQILTPGMFWACWQSVKSNLWLKHCPNWISANQEPWYKSGGADTLISKISLLFLWLFLCITYFVIQVAGEHWRRIGYPSSLGPSHPPSSLMQSHPKLQADKKDRISIINHPHHPLSKVCSPPFQIIQLHPCIFFPLASLNNLLIADGNKS